MKLIDVLHSPWAILPDKLVEIQAIYATHLRGDKIDIEAVEKRIGRPLDNSATGAYEITDEGVAIIALDGVLAKRANLLTQISGGTSTSLAARDIRAAAGDASVKAIILAIDSPGGTVDGTQALAQEIKAADAKKPVVAWASGAMASAAYWAGSAARAIYIADGTTMVGSIGVVQTHVDTSGADAQAGVKKTDVFAGKFKRIASSNAPLSEDGAAYMQAQVDYTYSLMVADIAAQRGVTVEKVVEDMAEGRVFMGQQAIDAGLADGVSALDALIAKLSEGAGALPSRNSGAGDAHLSKHQGANMLTAEQVQTALNGEHSAIADALRTGAAKAERERISAIQALATPGCEKVIEAHVADPTKTAGDTAQAILAAQKTALAAKAEELAQDAKDAGKVKPGAAKPEGDEKKPMSREELHEKAVAYQKAQGCSYIDAVRHLETQPEGA